MRNLAFPKVLGKATVDCTQVVFFILVNVYFIVC